MSLSRSWQFVGSNEGVPYRVYDWLRRRLNGRLVAFLAEHLPESSSNNASPAIWSLEAGSGTAFASSLFQSRRRVAGSVCLDLDETALREAKRRDPKLHAVVADISHMPFAPESFALVFNNSTVEHLDDPTVAVTEMQRVCRSDGRVFVGVPYLFGPLAFQPLIGKTSIGVWLGPVFSRAALYAVMNRAGLTPLTSIRFFWNFFVGAVAAKTNAPQTGSVAGVER